MDCPDEAPEKILDPGDPMTPYISRTHTNAQVHAPAEKYDIPGLKFRAGMKFGAATAVGFGPGFRSGAPAMMHLIAIISLVYDGAPGTDRVLRDAVIGYMWMYWKQLSPKPEFLVPIAAKPEFMIEAVNKTFGPQLP